MDKADKLVAAGEQQGAAGVMLQAFERATTPEAAEKALELYERIFLRERDHADCVEYDAAMARVQSRVPSIVADAENAQTSSKYVKTCTLNKELKPIYTAEEFHLDFDEADSPKEGMTRYVARCSRGGYSRDYHVDLPPDNAGIRGTANKTMIHALKSSGTYAQGILLRRIFNIADALSDDDGNAGGGAPAKSIDAKNVKIIRGLLAKLPPPTEEAMLSAYNAENVESLPADQLAEVMRTLNRKLKKLPPDEVLPL